MQNSTEQCRTVQNRPLQGLVSKKSKKRSLLSFDFTEWFLNRCKTLFLLVFTGFTGFTDSQAPGSSPGPGSCSWFLFLVLVPWSLFLVPVPGPCTHYPLPHPPPLPHYPRYPTTTTTPSYMLSAVGTGARPRTNSVHQASSGKY